jgi:hypothetical protein
MKRLARVVLALLALATIAGCESYDYAVHPEKVYDSAAD